MARKRKQDWTTRIEDVIVLIWSQEKSADDSGSLMSVYSSMEKAYAGAARIIADNIESDPHRISDREDRAEILERIRDGRYEDALSLYQEALHEEQWEFLERRIDDENG